MSGVDAVIGARLHRSPAPVRDRRQRRRRADGLDRGPHGSLSRRRRGQAGDQLGELRAHRRHDQLFLPLLVRRLPWDDLQAYWKRSPLAYVGNVHTPTMLMTGEADYRTPSSEAEQFYEALKLRKVDTALVRVPERLA